jgi:hypothetical protein
MNQQPTPCAGCGEPVPGTAGQPSVVAKGAPPHVGLTLCGECAEVFKPATNDEKD